MDRVSFLIVILSVVCLQQAVHSISPTGYPTSISYNPRAFTINGTNQLLLSGCVHYPRSAPSQWPGILKLTKDAGLDVVQTYVFWNLHQPNGPDDWDFDGRANIWEFLNQCQQAGLFVNLRIGPYVCAEWTLGGIPVWVKNIPGIVFRDYNDAWLQAMGKFVSRFTLEALSRKVFAHQGGPVILAQIENEYGNVEGSFQRPKDYVQWSVALAQNLTNKEPWIMCQQDDAPSVPNLVNTCNGFYCDNWLPGHFSSRKTPAAWTENWPGWFQNWGSPKPHRPVQDVAFAVARWIARGGSHMNYYMWHGGTTWGRYTGGPRLVTSYDYDVALNEYGLPHNPKYSHSAALHHVLQQYAQVLVANPVDPGKQLANNLFVNVYGTPNSQNCVAFLSNIGNSDLTANWNGNSYKVPGWSVSILGGCGSTVTFNTAQIKNSERNSITSDGNSDKNSENSERTAIWNSISAKRAISQNSWSWSFWQEPVGPSQFSKIIHSNNPSEQIRITNDDTDYLWYVTDIPSSVTGNVQYISDVRDFALVFADDQLGAVLTNGDQVRAQINVHQGASKLYILSQTIGLQNYGAHYESSISDGIAAGKVYLAGRDITNNGWDQAAGLLGEYYQVYGAGINKVSWNSSTSGGLNRPITWWKVQFPTPSGSAPLALDITGLTKGFAYVNGQGIGRYWNIIASGSCPLCRDVDASCDYRGAYNPGKCDCDCGIPSQQYYHVPRDWLNSVGQMNNLVIFEEVGAVDVTKVSLVTISS